MNATRTILLLVCWLAVCEVGFTQTAPVERKVAAPTRLDWEFASQGFKPAERKLPANYDSTKQRYQLFVPKSDRKDKPAALVLFISAGDSPQGWKNWQKLCEQEGVFFASPFGAGNSPMMGQRTRVILDVLDDIRRNYAIDPDQTYLTGFSGGGRMACAIGFALPEYFGGVIPLCGTNPITGPTYLRHRIADRLSVAFVTGEKDMNRKENEEYLYPWFQDIKVRSKLWVVPKMDHAIPPASVVGEVHAWLTEDLKRRREDRQKFPKLAVAADDTPTSAEQAKRFVESAQDDIKAPTRTWRSVALLQGVTQRWGTTDAGKQAQRLLKDVLSDDKLLDRVEMQGTDDEVKSVTAQAKAMERFGQTAQAIAAWEVLAKNYQGMPIAATAMQNIERLRAKGK
jgi:poly(3-hydroxybutyrate) depolymerase